MSSAKMTSMNGLETKMAGFAFALAGMILILVGAFLDGQGWLGMLAVGFGMFGNMLIFPESVWKWVVGFILSGFVVPVLIAGVLWQMLFL